MSRLITSAGTRNLTLAIVAVAAGERLAGSLPAPEPLDLDDPFIPLPHYLPAGTQAHTFGAGFCALDQAGAIQATWFEMPLPPGEPLVLGWDEREGPAPVIEVLHLGERSALWVAAVWSAVSAERPPVVIVRAGRDSCWMVGGFLPKAELAQIAASLPHG